MIVVIDNFLDNSLIIPSFIEEFKDIKEAPELVKTIMDKANNYFDLSELKYYEAWTHENTIPGGMHYDKDELLYIEGELKFPLCSTVFYPNVSKDIEGGRLLFHDEGVIVEPRFNRLVIFSPGLLHGVEPFRGKRTSININPWENAIKNWTVDYEGSTE